MQRLTMVRYAVKPDRAVENKALASAVFKEIRRDGPADVVYAVFQDGLEFVHLFVNVRTDSAEVLTELPSFKTYLQDLQARCEAPPEVTRLTLDLVESYGLAECTG